MSCQDHPSLPRVVDLEDLQPFGERPQGSHRAQAVSGSLPTAASVMASADSMSVSIC